MPNEHRPLKVFLSYASQDRSMVRELSRRLVDEGWIDTWLDEKRLLPGEDWRLKIEEAVENSDIVIICLSSNSVTKEGYVQKELRYAREIALEKPDETIFLIPVRLDDCIVPRGLRFYQWGDYFGDKKEDTYDSLLQALKIRHEQKVKHEESEHARKEQARLEREAFERVEREKTERELAKKIAREEAQMEAAAQARTEGAEREVAEKTAREQAKRDVAEKAKRERAERRAAQINALKELFFDNFVSFKPAISKAKPFFRIAGLTGIGIGLLWASSWAVHQAVALFPIPTASITFRPTTATAPSSSLVPFTKTVKPSSTPTRVILATPTTLPTEIANAQGVPMVLVPAGEFTMGGESEPEHSAERDSAPAHTVYLDTFYIDKYEVSNQMYMKCVSARFCTPPVNSHTSTQYAYYGDIKYADYPVVNVSWDNASAYCEWIGGRLPSEAEWEKAGRGIDGRLYPWGDTFIETKANILSGSFVPVDSFVDGASVYGAINMFGNAMEWVNDWYAEDYYESSPLENPKGPEDGALRVVRGFVSTSRGYASLFSRGGTSPKGHSNSFTSNDGTFTYFYEIGFRCAKSP